MPEAQLFCLLSTLFLKKGCYTPQLSLLLTSKDNRGGVKQLFFRKRVDKKRLACILLCVSITVYYFYVGYTEYQIDYLIGFYFALFGFFLSFNLLGTGS